MKLPMLKFARVKLSSILWTILLLTIILEILIAYKYLYMDSKARNQIELTVSRTSVEIDAQEATRARFWFEARRSFILPPYQLSGTSTGRENPFDQP